MIRQGWTIAALLALPITFGLGWLASEWLKPVPSEPAPYSLVQSTSLKPVIEEPKLIPLDSPTEIMEVIDLVQVFESTPQIQTLEHFDLPPEIFIPVVYTSSPMSPLMETPKNLQRIWSMIRNGIDNGDLLDYELKLEPPGTEFIGNLRNLEGSK